MLIELYVQEIHNLIQSYEMVKLFNLEYEKRGLYEGFIRGIIHSNRRRKPTRLNFCATLRNSIVMRGVGGSRSTAIVPSNFLNVHNCNRPFYECVYNIYN